MLKSSLILGQGSLGQQLKNLLENAGLEVLTWAKHERPDLSYSGDLLNSKKVLDLPSIDLLLIILSPSERNAESYQQLYDRTISYVLGNLKYKKVIFCSSTAVYPTEILYPQDEDQCLEYSKHFRGRSLRQAEKHIQYFSPTNFIIFRIGRIVRAYHNEDQKRAPGINAISQESLARIISHIILKRPKLNGIYNICSDQFQKLSFNSGKKISNLKIKAQLGFKFYDAC